MIHIEAGLRSFNKSMPEEINRISCDHMSTLLFSPTKQGVDNLQREGFKINNQKPFTIDNPRVYHCGDIMFDNSLYFSELSASKSILKDLNLKGAFILCTIHRNNNTDVPERLTSIFEALIKISEEEKIPVVLPLHPRTKKMMEVNLSKELQSKIQASQFIKIIEPVSFLEMIALEKNASFVMTDTGKLMSQPFTLFWPR